MKRTFIIGLSIAILTAIIVMCVAMYMAPDVKQVAHDKAEEPAVVELDETAMQASEFIGDWYEGGKKEEKKPEDGVSLSVAWTF